MSRFFNIFIFVYFLLVVCNRYQVLYYFWNWFYMASQGVSFGPNFSLTISSLFFTSLSCWSSSIPLQYLQYPYQESWLYFISLQVFFVYFMFLSLLYDQYYPSISCCSIPCYKFKPFSHQMSIVNPSISEAICVSLNLYGWLGLLQLLFFIKKKTVLWSMTVYCCEFTTIQFPGLPLCSQYRSLVFWGCPVKKEEVWKMKE